VTAPQSDRDRARPLRPRQPPSVPVADLVRLLDTLDPPGADARRGPVEHDVRVTGITQDSRAVEPGDLYVARAGGRTHGADHAGLARAAGAVAALTDTDGAARCRDAGLATLVATDPAAVAGPLAHELYGHPAAAMTMIGITGTNGKTTTSFFVEAALRALGHRPGLIGTIAVTIAGPTAGESTVRPAARTTPESTELAATLATMREAGCDTVVMEVSSHALALARVDGIHFAAAGFLNLAEDHLDLHGDMESYFAAKASLFATHRASVGVVDIDTGWGRRLASRAPIPIVTVSTAGRPGDGGHAADVGVDELTVDATGGTHATIRLPHGRAVPVDIEMPGLHNLADAVMAVTLVDCIGGDPAVAAGAIATARVPGRMERFDLPGGAVAFVDYAHTPEAITSALAALVRPAGARILAVAGCGGDRDPGKRGPMGAALARGADVVVVTDDNPRSEDPAGIRAAALAGARSTGFAGELVEIGDRAAAIVFALDRAAPGDVVIVLGKGHEQGQDVAGTIHPFDDRERIRAWVAAR
jgi:UDP-N-acetylmuramoyl-L-alanyl-D-glutamate--2,6-diaminopimelate ligase